MTPHVLASNHLFAILVAGFAGLSCTSATAQSFDWAGPYGGLHLGYAVGESTAIPIDIDDPSDLKGAFLGAQIGYNFQSGPWVFGVEADVSTTNIENDLAGGTIVNRDEYVELNWMATLRGRAGYAFNKTLVYGTIGAAAANVTAIDWDAGPESATNNHSGLALGAGVEFALSDRSTLVAEYQHVDLKDEVYNLGLPDDVGVSSSQLKLGFNIHF